MVDLDGPASGVAGFVSVLALIRLGERGGRLGAREAGAGAVVVASAMSIRVTVCSEGSMVCWEVSLGRRLGLAYSCVGVGTPLGTGVEESSE